jgi:hypothetical protein
MSDRHEHENAEANLADLRSRYNRIGVAGRGRATGEPDNSGKTIDDFLAKALDFARTGRILGLVGFKKHIRT